jgi:hypothetical protein
VQQYFDSHEGHRVQVRTPLQRIANAANRRHNGGPAASCTGHTTATDAMQQNWTTRPPAATSKCDASTCEDPVGAAALAATASVDRQPDSQHGLQAGCSDAMVFKQFVAELKEALDRRRYQQVCVHSQSVC